MFFLVEYIIFIKLLIIIIMLRIYFAINCVNILNMLMFFLFKNDGFICSCVL